MQSPENGTRQSAYEIDIREAFTGRSVWNSGKVYSTQSQLVSIEGADIRPDNLIIVGGFVFGMRQMHPLNGVVKQSFALLLQDSLRENGLELSLVRMLIYRKDASFMVES